MAGDILAQVIPQIWLESKTTFEDGTITYTGEPIALDYHLSSPTGNAEAGYILFVDGIVQPYRVANPETADEGEDAPIHIFRLDKDATRDITILFDPVTGKKGDGLGFYFAVVLAPWYIPPDKEHPGYGHFSTLINREMPILLKMEADSPNPTDESYPIQTVVQPIPENQWTAGQTFEERADGSLRMWTNYLRSTAEKDSLLLGGYAEAKDGIAELSLIRTGGTSFPYRTTVFVNHRPILVDGHPNFSFDAEYGMETTIPFSLDIRSYPHLNTVYAVSVPVGDLDRIRLREANFLQSERLLLINDVAEK